MRFSSREPHLSGFYDFILNYCGNYVITAVRAKNKTPALLLCSCRTFWGMPMKIKIHLVSVDSSTISTVKYW